MNPHSDGPSNGGLHADQHSDHPGGPHADHADLPTQTYTAISFMEMPPRRRTSTSATSIFGTWTQIISIGPISITIRTKRTLMMARSSQVRWSTLPDGSKD